MSLLISLLFLCSPVEDSTLVFQQIEYASFDVNSHRTKAKDSVFINLYCSFSDDGAISIFNSPASQQHYSMRLSKDELKKINIMLTEKRKLRGHLAVSDLGENNYYAGSYDYYRVTYKNGTRDSICIIKPMASKSLREVGDMLDNLFYNKKERPEIPSFNIPQEFLLSLRKAYSKSNYLPPITNPPRGIGN